MKTRILASLIIIGLIGSFVTGSSFAAFNDVESSMNNLFGAGALDIRIGWEKSRNAKEEMHQEPLDDPGPIFDEKNIQPGETGEATIKIENLANPAFISLKAKQVGNKENGRVKKKLPKRKRYYKVVLVENYSLSELSEKNNYYTQNRLERYVHGEVGGEVEGRGYPNQVDCIKNSTEIAVENGKASANFTLKNLYKCGTGTIVSLVAYKKPYPGLEKSKLDQLTLYRFNTSNYKPGYMDGKPRKHTISVEIPGKKEKPDLSRGMIGHWKLDGLNGTAKDYSGNGHDLTVKNEPQRGVKGVENRAYELDGKKKQYAIGSEKVKIPQTYTMTAWIRGRQDNQRGAGNIYLMGFRRKAALAIQRYDGKPRTGVLFRKADDREYYNGWPAPYKHFNRTNILDGEWHHLTGIINRKRHTIRVFVDGELVHAETYDVDHWSGSRQLIVGSNYREWSHFTGRIDDARMYRRGLSAYEVQKLANKAKSPDYYGNKTVWEDNTSKKGELGQTLRFKLWYDDGDNRLQKDEQLIFKGTAHEFGKYDIGKGMVLDGDASTNKLDEFPNGTSYIGFKWRLPKDAGCEVQTDSKTFKLLFKARQARHNSGPVMHSLFFGDREASRDNYFQAGVFDRCNATKPEKTGKHNHNPGKGIEKETGKKNVGKAENRTCSSCIQTKNQGSENRTWAGDKNGYLGHWKFDGMSYEVNDVFGNHGENKGARRGVSGAVNRSFYFDGTDKVTIPHLPIYRFPNGTVSLWFRPGNATNSTLLSKQNVSCKENCTGLALKYRLGVLKAVIEDGNATSLKASSDLDAGKWHHATVVVGRGKAELFLDGKLQDRMNHTSIVRNRAALRIGDGFEGRIDELRLYSKALTPQAIEKQAERGHSDDPQA